MDINKGNNPSGRDNGDIDLNSPEFVVFSSVQIARRNGNRYYPVAERSDSIDCHNREQAENILETLHTTVDSQLQDLQQKQELQTTGSGSGSHRKLA